MSPIIDFYKNQTVFLTGATGFIGKLCVEKLLRTCPDIKKIYVLVRPKRGLALEDRFKGILDSPCFEHLKSLNPSIFSKIVLLSGDCSKPFVGLSPEDQDLLKEEVNCVIHAAANVRFDTDLRTAVYTNVRSVRDLLNMAKDMKNLKAFIYVSTAFSHCIRSTIDEEFYEVDFNAEKLLAMVDVTDDKLLEILAPYLLGKWPNSYVYTKAYAESVIRDFKQELPIAVVRPAIVISTFEEPFPGWIDGFHGLVGVVIGVSLGVIRSLPVNTKYTARIVPVDYVVNTILATVWNVATTKTEDKKQEVQIYNYMGSNDNQLDWGRFTDILKGFTFRYPLSSAVWYRYVVTTHFLPLHKVRAFFLHTLFAYFADAILIVAGKGALAVGKYRKIDKLVNLLAFFTTSKWDFRNKNVVALWDKLDEDDKKIFKFDMSRLNWSDYLEVCAVGGRTILLKDPLDNLSKARRKMYLLFAVHYVFVALFFYYLYRWLLAPLFHTIYPL